LLTPVVLLVHGYHPLADDGAIYVAGVKKLLNPDLFPSGSVFVLAPTRLSVFAHVLAAIVGWTHLPLSAVLLACQLLSIFLFLTGCYRVAGWGAALLGACLFTLPVAGTSLSLMDPYVTARSFSTPFTLFALAAVIEESWMWAAVWIALTALVHPLMAAYALLALATLALTQRKMWRSLAGFAGLGWILCTVFFFLTRHEPSPAALSRSYFFLSSWQWFEYFGLVVPLLLLAVARVVQTWSKSKRWRTAGLFAGSLILCIYIAGFIRQYFVIYVNPWCGLIATLQPSYKDGDIVVFDALYGQVPFDAIAKESGFKVHEDGLPETIYRWWDEQPAKVWGGPVLRQSDVDATIQRAIASTSTKTVWLVLYEVIYYDPRDKLLAQFSQLGNATQVFQTAPDKTDDLPGTISLRLVRISLRSGQVPTTSPNAAP